VVVVFATRGEAGIVPAELADPAGLGELRAAEAQRAADLLGAARVAFLGYRDSGDDPGKPTAGAFADADPAEAAGRLAAILREEGPVALVVYDPMGVTGHPDHVQSHRVGVRAAGSVPGLRVYEGTLSESQLTVFGEVIAAFAAGSGAPPGDGGGPALHPSPDELVTTRVDVRPWLAVKRAAMAAHASQIGPDSFFLALTEADFARVFGLESYIDRVATDVGAGPLEAALAETGALG
jgi:LmbE family N-acetylglucosaminyl deacetylase